MADNNNVVADSPVFGTVESPVESPVAPEGSSSIVDFENGEDKNRLSHFDSFGRGQSAVSGQDTIYTEDGEYYDDQGNGPPMSPIDELKTKSSVSSAASSKIGASWSRPFAQKHLDTFGAFSVQVVTMAGAGVLFYPYVFSELGYVMSIIFLCLAGFTWAAMCNVYYHTVQGLKRMYPDETITRLEHVAKLCCGQNCKYIYFFLLYLTLFILCSTFFILTAELMTGFVDLAPNQEVANVPTSHFYWAMIFAIPQIAMSFLHDLKSIKYVLQLGVVAIVIVVVTQVVLCAVAISDDFLVNHPTLEGTGAVAEWPAENSGFENWKLVLGSLTTFLYGFGALIVSGQVITDMGPNHHSFPKATIYSHATVTGIYILYGGLGYAAFGSGSPPAFLSPDSVIATDYYPYWAIASICMIIDAVVKLPIFFNSMFRGLVVVLPAKKQNNWGYIYTMRIIIVLLAMAVACTPVAWFADLTGLVPMTTIALICLILPSAFYWFYQEKEYSDEHNLSYNSSWKVIIKRRWWLFAIHVFMNIILVIALVFGFWTALESLIDNIKGTGVEDT